MKNFKIDSTDIIITDDEVVGQGKLIISDPYMGSYSHWWGSMGGTMEEFLCSINKHYFTDKMLGYTSGQEYSPKLTMRNVRKYIKTEMTWELPWFRFMESQKELRRRLGEIQSYDSQDMFVNLMCSLKDDVLCMETNDYEEREFKEALEVLGREPWHFIATEPTRNAQWLGKLHGKIVKAIKKGKLKEVAV